MSKKLVSIILPILNESENIFMAFNKLSDVMQKTKYDYEIIFVSDGSTDDSEEKVKTLCNTNKNVKLLSLSRNFGQDNAILAGLKYSNGNCCISLDIDMQESEQNIINMLNEWDNNDIDIVLLKRRERKDKFLKKLTASMFYKTLRKLGVKHLDNLASFYLFDRKVVDAILSLNDTNINIKSQILYVGFKTKTLLTDRQKREFGKTKYNYKKMFLTAKNMIVNTTKTPLYISFYVGILLFVLSIITFVSFTFVEIFAHNLNYFWLIPCFTILTSLICIFIGVLGLYLANIFDQTRNRPTYIIKEKINFED